MWYTLKMDYYSTLKRKKVLPYATTWVILEDILLTEINPFQKYCIIPLTGSA